MQAMGRGREGSERQIWTTCHRRPAVALAVRQATKHLTRLCDGVLAPTGLGLNQYSILAKVDRHGEPSVQQLAALLVMDRSTLGHLLRPLNRRGLLTVRPVNRLRSMTLTRSKLTLSSIYRNRHRSGVTIGTDGNPTSEQIPALIPTY
ncbi:MarR family winged helix-turn-helix transcriptional regulator [Methylobacterium mesophilicum]